MSDMCRRLIHKAICIELRQIKHLAMLACMAPDEVSRHMILRMIMEEAGEAMFWNTVDAAYRGVVWPAGPYPGMAPMPGVAPCPGVTPFPTMAPAPVVPVGPPVILPPAGPPLSPGGTPVYYPSAEKKDDKK